MRIVNLGVLESKMMTASNVKNPSLDFYSSSNPLPKHLDDFYMLHVNIYFKWVDDLFLNTETIRKSQIFPANISCKLPLSPHGLYPYDTISVILDLS